MTDDEQIAELVKQLDTTGFDEHEEPWAQLEPFGAKVAAHALKAYPRFRNWQGRTTLLLRMTRYARTEPAAFELGLAGCKDPSPVARVRACAVLAYSLRDDAILALEALADDNKDRSVREAAAAAIDAIRNKSHHYFHDRQHTGKSQWNPEDE